MKRAILSRRLQQKRHKKRPKRWLRSCLINPLYAKSDKWFGHRRLWLSNLIYPLG